MRKVQDAINTDTGDSVYFKTHAKVVYASDGVSVHRHMGRIHERVSKFTLSAEATNTSLPDVTCVYLNRETMNNVIGNLNLSNF